MPDTVAHHDLGRLLIAALDNYNDLNPSSIDELDEDPSPLEFMRHVARNRPFVIRRGAQHWTAVKTWSAARLCSLMGSRPVRVAITPHGNADSVVSIAGAGSLDKHTARSVFVEPLEEEEPFSSALDSIRTNNPSQPVRYLQTQNDNLRSPPPADNSDDTSGSAGEGGEYSPLWTELPPDIPFARIALQSPPDAVNFWLGSARSTTALHRDHYENVYVQMRGRKHFVLLPPVAGPAVGERRMARGRYERVAAGGSGAGDAGSLRVVVDEAQEHAPVPTWDPVRDATPPNVYGPHVRPMTVSLEEGDVMYLPALWYHHVRQSNGAEGFNCSVNYWYDMDFSGSFWTTNALLKDLTALADDASGLCPTVEEGGAT